MEKLEKFIAGGSFLTSSHDPDVVFTPEDFTDEDLMMGESTEQFVEGEIVPQQDRLEKCDAELSVELLRKAGELGMLCLEIPEAYGGMSLSKATACLMSEKLARTGGFIVTIGVQTGIGTMPILYFGNKEQREKYLEKLGNAEILSAYALTEESSGSDALNAKTKAVLSPDGKHYILNGTKMWISSAGFADLFIVFAKIDGKDFTAFIVHKDYPGVSVGAEEKKMGIKASSTRALILEDAEVPVENVLGEIGQGHKIAFNILNIGRFKLGAGCVGGAKYVLGLSSQYAQERQAFGKPISDFGMIKQKLGDMAIRTFAAESMLYRTAGYIDSILKTVDWEDDDASVRILKGIEEYAIECAMVKVFCSEVMEKVAYDAVQIHGGYGYSQEYAVERVYRDARINTIFEGTNEINRMLTIDMLLKRAMKGSIPLMEQANALMGEILGPPSFDFDQDFSVLSEEKKLIENGKKIFMFVAGAAFKKYLNELAEQQEILGLAADVLADVYVAESMLLRTLKKLEKDGEEAAQLMIDATTVFCHDAIERIQANAKIALAATEEGDTLQTMVAALKRLSKHKPVNAVALRRGVAKAALQANGYPF